MTDPIADAILYEGYMLYPYRASALKNQRRWTFGVLDPGAENLVCECLVLTGPTTEVEAVLRYFRIEQNVPHFTSVHVGPFGMNAPVITDTLRLQLDPVLDDVRRLHVEVRNPGPHLMASAQVLLHLSDGEWVAPRDPPQWLQSAHETCHNNGLWPILVGPPDTRQHLLCSPIIVDDYAQVAPESPRPFFDGTEIDELLALRIQTLSPAEQQEIVDHGDIAVRDLLQHVVSMPPQQLARLHGARRTLAIGQRVRLCPVQRADIMDLALAGRIATVVAIEQDLEQRTYVAVTVDDDPGNDLGALGQPGHRFFFKPDEVVPID
ncbi:MAG: hypothetical protein JO020_00325 [Chloroflexi bacterium]|nr:hypothetical protein [Chloroflexota bacterium]MBV9133453.1 hypothetical protein [Chloroflexota bacterium]MBV9892596.1 hypothetical protein [Chloroflexota bacterium]